ncbi:GNAT family N-acetyltransferase [Dyella ginsengisoli]|uniref:GNAT family N-acetyltransferase n=1 Tax=Dyella ginsengisoli TaxID=363848 RepID=UPI000345F63B|nr:GNAT family N-acetyltransferase [Dyella ginsengisoli]
MILRDGTADDAPAVLALNHAFVSVLSPLDDGRLAHLVAQATLYRVAEEQGRVLAFLLAMGEGADYDSPNYRWFAARYPRFLYIDRIVVAAEAQSLGLGAALYRDAFDHAASLEVARVTCEFDLAPPNPASSRFHARLGFREVGRQVLDAGKEVSLQAVLLADAVRPASD